MAQRSPDEVARYASEGGIVPRYRLPPDRVQAMAAALDDLLRSNPGVRPERLVSAHVAGDNGEGVRGVAAFVGLARDPEIVDLVAGVIGDDLVLWGCHVVCKPAREGVEDWTDLTLDQRMVEGSFDETQAVDIELEPGQMALHDVDMIHGAEANRSGQRRTGVALCHMPSSSLFDRSLRPADGQGDVPVNFAQRPPWLVKGVNRHGGNDFSVGHRP